MKSDFFILEGVNLLSESSKFFLSVIIHPEKFKSSDGVTKAKFKHFSDFAYHNIDAFKKMVVRADNLVNLSIIFLNASTVMISQKSV